MMAAQPSEYTKTHQTVRSKTVQFIICKLYLKRKKRKPQRKDYDEGPSSPGTFSRNRGVSPQPKRGRRGRGAGGSGQRAEATVLQALSPMFKTALRRTRRSQGPYSGGTLAEDTSPRQDKKHPHSVADFCAMHEPCGVGAFGVVTTSLRGHVDACHQLAFAE